MIDPVLYEIVANLISINGEKVYNSEIWAAILDKIPGAPIDQKKPNEYQSYEYDTAIKIIEGFGAEPDRDHNGRYLKFDLLTFVKSPKQFDIDIGLQTRLNDAINHKSYRHTVTPSRPTNDVKM